MAFIPEMHAAMRQYIANVPDNLGYILADELKEELDRNPERYFVLDNRTPVAFAQGHIPGAVNIPLREVLEPDNLSRIPRDRTVVVCCWVGHTASQLLPCLSLLGYNAVVLKYGMGEPSRPGEPKLGWQDRGLPTIGSSSVAS